MTPTLSVTASGFSASFSGLNGAHSIPVSKRRCMKFAQTIGLPLFRAASPTSRLAIALATYKMMAIKCAIDFTSSSLNLPLDYKKMDPTEQANISYWTGMTFSAIIADEILNVTHLIHATAFGHMGLAKINPKSRRLADLVGQDTLGAWHVLEAKARQDKPLTKKLNDWKKQAKTISTIQGVSPATNSYSLACVESTYLAKLVDPPQEEESWPITIKFEQNAIIKGYYGPVVDWLSERAITIEHGNTNLVVKRVGFDPTESEYVFLGLTENTLNTLKENKLPERLKATDIEDMYIGTDGVVLFTSTEPEVKNEI
jgi:hypothetical protein